MVSLFMVKKIEIMTEETRLKIAGIIHDLREELELNKGLKYRNGYREALDNVYSEINKLTIPIVIVPKGTLCGCGAELIKDITDTEYCGNTLCNNR